MITSGRFSVFWVGVEVGATPKLFSWVDDGCTGVKDGSIVITGGRALLLCCEAEPTCCVEEIIIITVVERNDARMV